MNVDTSADDVTLEEFSYAVIIKTKNTVYMTHIPFKYPNLIS